MTCQNCSFYKQTKVKDLGLCTNQDQGLMHKSLVDSELKACPMFLQAMQSLQAMAEAHQAA